MEYGEDDGGGLSWLGEGVGRASSFVGFRRLKPPCTCRADKII